MRLPLLAFLLTTATPQAQWDIQNSHTTTSLRGIHALGNGIAWASGTEGTVLRTTDDGATWQTCPTPPAAEHLDFRGIQAFDQNTAIVMSSGKGDLSRLYKTTDACRTWKLVFTNPDKEGFWDAIQFADKLHGFLLGDPVAVAGSTKKHVVFKQTIDGGNMWISWERTVSDLAISDDMTAFAASNSSLIAKDRFQAVAAVGGKGGSAVGFPGNSGFVTHKVFYGDKAVLYPSVSDRDVTRQLNAWWALEIPFPQTETGGIFSIAMHEKWIVAVGGDFRLPASAVQTAAFSEDSGWNWHPAQTPPHGYRSAVAYSADHKAWITVGPNGTDLSTDDGKNWRALKPTLTEPPDADRNWNALSLPFVVGPKGRIGHLRPDALSSPTVK